MVPAPARPVGRAAPQQRIIGGAVVDLSVDPKINFQVGLEIQLFSGSVERCGGSIIGPQHVLTAAHCLTDELTRAVDTKPTFVTVIPGITFSDRSQAKTANAFWVHSTYLAGNTLASQDLAVIRISGNFTFSTSVGMIDLSTSTNCASCEAASTPYFVSGYGFTDSSAGGNSGLSNQLRYVAQLGGDFNTCQTRLQTNVGNPNVGLAQHTICAGSDPVNTAGKDSCQGDSGGPLFVQKPAGSVPRFVQVGVLSAGTAQSNPLCGVAQDFGLYVSGFVASFGVLLTQLAGRRQGDRQCRFHCQCQERSDTRDRYCRSVSGPGVGIDRSVRFLGSHLSKLLFGLRGGRFSEAQCRRKSSGRS